MLAGAARGITLVVTPMLGVHDFNLKMPYMKNLLQNYEGLTEMHEHQLVGGFSKTYSEHNYSFTEGSNNCLATNCAANCSTSDGNSDASCRHNAQPLCN